MDSLQVTKPAPEPLTAASPGPPSLPVAACCATAMFPAGGVRSWLENRRVLAVGGIAIGGAGLALGWDWLAAIGIAPLIVAAAPCLIMCALGMCMMGRGQQAAYGKPTPDAGEPRTPTDLSASR